MSQRAYMLAARDAIRTALSLDAHSCEVTFDGQPKPACGEKFIAVHPGEWRGESGDADLSESIGFQVTLTRRLGFSPQDRWGPEVLLKATEGMEPLLRTIILTLHKSQSVRIAANAYINSGVTTYEGFHEPVKFADGGKAEPKGPDWFSSESEWEGKYANAGLAQTITFSGAKRIQGLSPYDIS